MEGLEGTDPGLELLGPAIVMEGDDVAFCELNFGYGALFGRIAPITGPDAAGEGLGGVSGPSPVEGLGEEGGDQLGLILRLAETVAVVIVGLVPDVPGEDAVVFGEGRDDADDIFLRWGS